MGYVHSKRLKLKQLCSTCLYFRRKLDWNWKNSRSVGGGFFNGKTRNFQLSFDRFYNTCGCPYYHLCAETIRKSGETKSFIPFVFCSFADGTNGGTKRMSRDLSLSLVQYINVINLLSCWTPWLFQRRIFLSSQTHSALLFFLSFFSFVSTFFKVWHTI